MVVPGLNRYTMVGSVVVTPILVNIDESPEVDEWLSKSRSRIIIIFTYTPYYFTVTGSGLNAVRHSATDTKNA